MNQILDYSSFRLFSHESLEQIYQALQDEATEWSLQQHQVIVGLVQLISKVFLIFRYIELLFDTVSLKYIDKVDGWIHLELFDWMFLQLIYMM